MPSSRYQLLSVAEAAEMLRRKRWFIYGEIEKRRLPFHRIGGQICIRQRDLDDYVERSRQPALGERKKKIIFPEVAAE
jgi:excisionase family DNA binding protein